jgi:hypothetical protein
MLIATNILSVSNAAFHASVYEFFSKIPYDALLTNSPMRKQYHIEAENSMLQKNNQKLLKDAGARHAKVKNARVVSERIVKRVARNSAVNLASVAGEAVPYLGVALVVSVTAMDLKDGCDTARDVNEMLNILDAESIDDVSSEVCGMKVPSAEEVVSDIKRDIGGTVHEAKERATDSARKLYDALGGTMYEIFNR